MIVLVAGFFTIRSNVARIWRENFEAKDAEVKLKDEQIEDIRAALLQKSEEKHAALAEAAAAKLLLEQEKQKTDLTLVTLKLESLEATFAAAFEEFERRVIARHKKLAECLPDVTRDAFLAALDDNDG